MSNSSLSQPASGSQTQSPAVEYWHVWTDSDGISHQSRCQLQNFILKSISSPADPQWLNELKKSGASVVFTVMPVGWVGSWHENPKPQWIVPLSGCWFVETMDGQRVEMGVGEISFGEDRNTQENDRGQKGHLSGTVGNVPAVLMIVQLDEEPTVGQACRFQ